MSWRAGGAIASAVVTVASFVLHDATSGRAFAPAPRPQIPVGTELLHRSADSGVDIVRMPPRRPAAPPSGGTPTALQPPAVTPPAVQPPVTPPSTPPVAPPANQPPQPQGRVVKVTVKIGSLSRPTSPRRDGSASQMDALSSCRSRCRSVSQRQWRAHRRGDRRRPRRPGGARFGDIVVASTARHRRHERLAPARVGDDARHRCRVGRVAHHRRRRRFPADAAPAGRWRQRPRHVSAGPDVRGPASAWRATRPRRCTGIARARPPATRGHDGARHRAPRRARHRQGPARGRPPAASGAADKDNLEAMYRLRRRC